MNPIFLLATIAAAFIGSAQAGYTYIFSPYASTQCVPGTPCPIAWHVSQDGPEFSRIDIELLAGDAQSASVIAPIVLGYDLSQGNTYLWNVPQNSIPQGSYFIRIKGVGTDYQSYSHSFPISFNALPASGTGTTGGTATGTATGTGTIVPTNVSTSTGTSAVRTSSISTNTRTSNTKSSSAMSIQGSVSFAAAVVAAAFAIMMF